MKLSALPIRKVVAALSLALGCAFAGNVEPARAQTPSWPSSSVIYCIFPEIFSSNGLSGVTAQLNRLHTLGVNVIWLMPFQPRGQAGAYAGQARPTYNSPYCMSNLEGIASKVGTSSDLITLITGAHQLGMKVILDVALNQTSWDNPLLESNPQYYYHSDGNPNNVNSIEEAWSDADIAGVDILNDTYGAQDYMTGVCKYWLQTYNFDGFRFDSADNPGNSSRTFAQSYAKSLYSTLSAVNPSVLFLGEENDEALALAPYNLDYGWSMQSTLKSVANGSSAAALQATFNSQTSGWPSGMLHMAVTQDWDTDEDLTLYGGAAQTLDAAAYDYTIPGVPLLYNGEEVGNDNSGTNTHNPIDWNSPNAANFQSFYAALIAVRSANPALQKGSMAWESNSVPASVVTYDRISGSNEVYVEISFSTSAQSGTCTIPAGGGTWSDVSPSGSPGGMSHPLPSAGTFSLAANDFAVFKRALTKPSAPTGVTATAGNAQIGLAWSAVPGAATYTIYGGTTPSGESSTPVKTGVAATTFTVTPLTNGTTYYYKAAAASGGGTSSHSAEVSATPNASNLNGKLSGTLTILTAPATVNLTGVGTTDWAAWGYKGSSFDHKASGGGKISNVSVYGGGSENSFTSNYLGFTWTDGAPDASASGETNGYTNPGGNGDGFTFSVPAGKSMQTLTVYLGGYTSGGAFTAQLSDGSAQPYVDSSFSSADNSYYGYCTLTFRSSTANQKLTITWKQTTSDSQYANLCLYGAALH